MDKPTQTPSNTITVEEQIRRARQELEKSFKDFHELLNNKVLDANKSNAQQNTERQVVDKLYRSAVVLENINIGEGVMSLAIIAVREMLKVRDRVNELEYELFKMKKDIAKLSGAPKSVNDAKE